MKGIKLAIALFFLVSFQAKSEIMVNISGAIFNTNIDSVFISKYYGGTNYVNFIGAPLNKTKENYFEFNITGKLNAPDYYVIRFGNQHLNLILRNNSAIKIYCDGKNVNAFYNIVGSPESKELNDFVIILSNFNITKDSMNYKLQKNPEQKAQLEQSFEREYNNFQSQKQQFMINNQNSPALIPVLSTLNVEKEFSTYESIVNQLVAGFGESPTVKDVKKNYDQYKAQKDAANIFAPGKPALEIEGLTPDGKKIKLSDLKGKVVLIDFWASWCRPCRAENPNVVKIYNEYNKQGFTVFSVSLDQDKQRWIDAIAQDGLVWKNHVSDLKGWQSELSKPYQVSGIPFTVLIDKEGKIVKTNLRGEALHEELKKIFGK